LPRDDDSRGIPAKTADSLFDPPQGRDLIVQAEIELAEVWLRPEAEQAKPIGNIDNDETVFPRQGLAVVAG
jgi:hypothetical protein